MEGTVERRLRGDHRPRDRLNRPLRLRGPPPGHQISDDQEGGLQPPRDGRRVDLTSLHTHSPPRAGGSVHTDPPFQLQFFFQILNANLSLTYEETDKIFYR